MTDIKHTDTGDLDLSMGDLQYTTSDYQHQKDILLSRKGYYKEFPVMGVDILEHVNETEPEALLRAIKKSLPPTA